MGYVLHPAAEQDLAAIVDYYIEHAGNRVAERFIAEFRHVATLLVEHPELGTLTRSGQRAFPFRLFPYAVVYRVRDSEIYILVVRHQHRRPSYGRSRR